MLNNFEVRAPLFERLVDRDPKSRRELRPSRTFDRGLLKASIRRELQRLLSTRSSLPANQTAGRELTVIDYGIPDFSTVFPKNQADRVRLAAVIRRAIEVFEPRLSQVSVRIEPLPEDHLKLIGAIRGVLVVDEVAEPISFATLFQNDSSVVEVHADQ